MSINIFDPITSSLVSPLTKTFLNTDTIKNNSSKKSSSDSLNNSKKNTTKTPAVVKKNGKIIEGAYEQGGHTYYSDGTPVTGDFTTICNGKIYTSGLGGEKITATSLLDFLKTKPESSSSDYYKDSSKKITASDAPVINDLSQIPEDKLKYGNVCINGEWHNDVPLYDGYFYNPKTGKAYTQELYQQGASKYYVVSEENGTPTGYYYYELPSSSGGGGGSYRPETIIVPEKIDFDIPVPSFTSDVKKVTKYTYYFGLDTIAAKKVALSANSCFVSAPILLDGSTEYLMFESDYFCGDNGSVEFYIIDGQNEFPIRPYNETTIHNESLFLNLEPRFAIDPMHPVIVKHFGEICNIPYTEIINNINLWTDVSNRYEYTISYTPANGDIYTPLYQTVYLKIILRDYDTSLAAPYIKRITLRNYTKGGFWQ